ncbi:MAG: hypothetical protein KDD55_10670, partial [Bdellovibrionales bacterium]|nr:hypothetical protein [Bdellovibrionales bacterium]
ELTLASPGMDDQRFKTITDERRLAGWAQLTDSDPMYTFFADANDLSTFYQYSFLGNLDGGLTDVGYYYTGDKVFNLESLVASDITLDLPGCEVQDGGFSVTDNGTYMVSTLCEVSPGDYKYFATVIRPTSAVASELPGDPIEPILLSEYTLDLSGGDDVSNPEPEENETPSIDTPETPAPSSPEGEDEPEIADPISSLDLLLQAKDSLKDAIQAFKKARGKQAKREARMELRQALKDFRAALKAAKEDGFTPTRKDKRPKRTAKKLLKRPRRA